MGPFFFCFSFIVKQMLPWTCFMFFTFGRNDENEFNLKKEEERKSPNMFLSLQLEKKMFSFVCFCYKWPKTYMARTKYISGDSQLLLVRVQKIAWCFADWLQFVNNSEEKGGSSEPTRGQWNMFVFLKSSFSAMKWKWKWKIHFIHSCCRLIETVSFTSPQHRLNNRKMQIFE